MTLQLGFNGAIKLISGDDAALRECLNISGQRYQAMAETIDPGEAEKEIYWRIIFSIVSVNSRFDATRRVYEALRLWSARFGRLPNERKLGTILRIPGVDGVVQYANSKARYIKEFDSNWRMDRGAFTRNGDDDLTWRMRMKAAVKGLGMAKSSFAVALSSPASSDVCCIDTHMFQLFTGTYPRRGISKGVYLGMEERVRGLAREAGISTFACQWCLWDAKRGIVEPHNFLGGVV